MSARLPLYVLACLFVAHAAAADTDPEREARELERMLIAPCCFSQQVSEHNSPAAGEARKDIRARLARGETRQQILDAYVAQYGKHVLAEPPASGFDRLLYVIPPFVFLLSAGGVALLVRRFSRLSSPPPDATGPPPTDAVQGQALDDALRDLD